MEDHDRGLVSVLRAADAAIAGSALGAELRAWQDPEVGVATAAAVPVLAGMKSPLQGTSGSTLEYPPFGEQDQEAGQGE